MIFRLLLLFASLLLAGAASALTIHEVKYASQADLKVYRVRYASQADLRIHWVDYRSQARGDALWWRAPYASQAQLKVFFVSYASQADRSNGLCDIECRNKAARCLLSDK